MRSTPWVAGCDGPMFTVMMSGSVADRSMLADIVSAAIERKLLAERMVGVVVRHQDAPEVGMTREDDAEHVVGLALVPLRGGPDPGDRRHRPERLGPQLQPQPVVPRQAVQVVDDLD